MVSGFSFSRWASAREDLPDARAPWPQARLLLLSLLLSLSLALALPLALALALASSPANAQQIDTNQFVNVQPLPDLAWALRPVWGLNPGEFMIAAYVETRPPGSTIGGLWRWTDALGIPIIEFRGSLLWTAATDTLADSALGRTPDGTWRHRLIVNLHPISWIGFAREALFYPFDSAASFSWQCRFLAPRVNGAFPGYLARNPIERDHKNDSMQEQVYDTATTAPGATVAAAIAFGYDSSLHIRRWKNGPWDDSVQNSSAFFTRNDLDISHDNRAMFVVLSAHLFDDEHGGREYGVGHSDTLLAVDLVNEIPAGATWLDADGVVRAATTDTSFVYDTRFVTKEDLLPPVEDGVTLWSRYRAVPLHFDMKRRNDTGHGGPFHAASSAHRMDLRVRWSGTEKLALRSLALRDTMAQLLLGEGAEAAAFRQAVIDSVERVLRGASWNNPADSVATTARLQERLGKMMRVYTGDEGDALRNVGFTWLDSLLYRRYGGGDSLTRGFRAYRAQANPIQGDAMSAGAPCDLP